MSIWMIRIALLGCLWMGCSNPFSTDSRSLITGEWKSQNPNIEPQSIAFLSRGRYYENQIQVGVYVVTGFAYSASPLPINEGWNHWVRIDYLDGERIQIIVRASTTNPSEIRIATNVNDRGPARGVIFSKQPTGDGL